MEIHIKDSKCFKMHWVELMQRGTIEKQRFEIRVLERATVMGEPHFYESYSSTSPKEALLRSWTVYTKLRNYLHVNNDNQKIKKKLNLYVLAKKIGTSH